MATGRSQGGRWRDWRADVMLTGALLLGLAALMGSVDPHLALTVDYLLINATVVPLLLRRHLPVVALYLSLGAEVGLYLRSVEGMTYLGMAICLFHIVARRPMRDVVLSIPALAVVLAMTIGSRYNPIAVALVIEPLALYLGGGFGVSIRKRVRYIAELQIELADSASRIENAVAQARSQERQRLATTLHDVISSTVGVAGLHAGALRRHADAHRFDRVDLSTELRHIEDACAAAQRDLRQLMILVGPTNPAESASVDDIVAPIMAAGLDVIVDLSGTLSQLAPAAQLELLAVLREALANALRHGDQASKARVQIAIEDKGFELSVQNRVRAKGTSPMGTGRGLALMENRLARLGGCLYIQYEGDEFSLHAVVPNRNGDDVLARSGHPQ